MDEEEVILGVDVVGCDEGTNGRSCISHEICGKYVQTGDILVFRWEAVPTDAGIEEVIKVFVIRDGSQENKMAVVIEDWRLIHSEDVGRKEIKGYCIVIC